MGKTGTTSIQNWLVKNADLLRSEYNLNVLKIYINNSGNISDGACHVLPVKVNINGDSNQFVQFYHNLDKNKRIAAIDNIFYQLCESLDKGVDIILSAEAFYTLLVRYNDDFIYLLNKLASVHEVLVAYYVRPQHSAMEAAWCQWRDRGE